MIQRTLLVRELFQQTKGGVGTFAKTSHLFPTRTDELRQLETLQGTKADLRCRAKLHLILTTQPRRIVHTIAL